MERLLLAPGALAALLGVALSAQFTLASPESPTTPIGFVGWALLMGGLLEMKLVLAVLE